MFIACDTQWRWASGMTALMTGLDYAAVNAVMDMLGVEDRRGTFEKVRVMELETMRIMAKKGR